MDKNKCSSCGEAPQKCSCKNKDFTKAVIEIDNPEQLVLLRKVVMPATLPEADNPPIVGKYHNVILKYEDTGNVYIYSSDGIPTAIEANVPREILAKIADLEEDIETEETRRISADDALRSSINTVSGNLTTLTGRVTTAEGDIDTIEGKIPNQATTQNQLADKNFVNSSIATNTANFIGTFNSVADLEAYSGTVTNNDYAFVIVTDAQGNTAYDRYKYNGDTEQWIFEYELNNSSFTAEQWASINSGITSGNVDKLTGLADVKTIGANLNLSQAGELSATDTTYTHFTGATASTDGAQGLVPGPLAGDEDKYLKGDGTWGAVQAGPTVVQTTGNSVTNVMSQNATTSMIFADAQNARKITIGKYATNNSQAGAYSVVIGEDAIATAGNSIAIGYYSHAEGAKSIAIGSGGSTQDTARVRANHSIAIGNSIDLLSSGYAISIGDNSYNQYASGSIALGSFSSPSAQGEMNIGLSRATAEQKTSYGYNGSEYRLLSGVYDPQNAHDAATKGYVDNVNSYSSTETTTGGVWVDGSPIYKKTIDIGVLPNNTVKNVAHGISGLRRVIKVEGYAYNSNNSLSYPLPFSSENASDNCIGLTVDSTYISVGTGIDRSGLTESYVTLYYIKSS